MRLRRIQLSAVRKLAATVAIDGMADGLNVIGGDNEEGKSSLLLALKCAFFLKHDASGSLRERLTTYGSLAPPEIQIDFDLAGQSYHLKKAFKRDGMRLSAAGRTMANADAEAELERLLQFHRPGRAPKALEPEHLGLAGFFWVDQGTSFDGPSLAATDQERITDVLGQQIGHAVTGERPDRLLAAARTNASTHWTDTWRLKKGSPLVDANAAVEQAQEQVQQLEQKRAALDGKVERLASLRATLERLQKSNEAGEIAEKLNKAREETKTLERLAAERRIKEEALAAAKANREQAEARRKQRAEVAQSIVGEHSAVEALQVQVKDLSVEVRTADLALENSSKARSDIDERAVSVSKTLRAAEQREQRHQIEKILETERQRQGLAAQLRDELTEVRKQIAGNPADAAVLKTLRGAEREWRDRSAALAAIATRIELKPHGERSATIDGQTIDSSRPLDLTDPVDLKLEGYGALRITPGGEDIVTLKASARSAEQEFHKALADLCVADLIEAERLATTRQVLKQDEKRLNDELARTLSNTTTDELAETIVTLETQVSEFNKLLDQQSPTDTASQSTKELQAEAVTLERKAHEAREQERLFQERYQTLRRQEALEQGRLEDRTARLVEMETRLAEARDDVGDDALAEAAQSAAKVERKIESELARLSVALEDGDVATSAAKVEMLQRQLAEIEGDDRKLRDQIRELAFEIRTEGGTGVGERLAEAQDRLELALRDQAQLALQADAWRLLVETLEQERRQLRDRFTEPVRQRLLPLIQRVLPRAMPVVDADTVSLTHLERAGQAEAFAELSLGTREQLAVLTRLAFAQLLLEQEGEAPPIILDDALVYADEERFDRMKLLLQEMSQQHQIIVLTCRPRDYRGLNARFYDLAACVVS